MPATTAPLIPPPCEPFAAAEASDGFAPDEATPRHRSPDALCSEAAGALVAEAVLLLVFAARGFVDLAGAAELAKTDVPPCLVTPAVEPLTRAWTELVAGVEAVLRLDVLARAAGFCELRVALDTLVPTALFVVADAVCVAAAGA